MSDRTNRVSRLLVVYLLVMVAASTAMPPASAQFFQFADLSVTKADSPDPATVGDEITYTIRVHNNGPSQARNVVLNDTLPAGVTFVSANSTNPAVTCTASTTSQVNCTLPNINSGNMVVVTIVVRADEAGLQTNNVTVANSRFDPNPVNNRATATTAVVAREADLALTKRDTMDPVRVGTVFSYILNVTNLGPGNASNVLVMDVLPAEVEFVAAPGCTEANATVTCAIASLPANASVEFTIQVEAREPGVAENVATADAAEPDANATNDAAVERTLILNRSADLGIEKNASTQQAVVGQVIDYSILVRNSGPDDAPDVEVVDVLPLGVTVVALPAFCDEDEGVVTCELGTVDANDSRLFVISVRADTTGIKVNRANVTGEAADANPANNTAFANVTVVPPRLGADLAVTKMDLADPVTLGQNVTYRINVTNNGRDNATGVEVVDQHPASFTFVSGSPGCAPAANSTVVCQIGNLTAGDSTNLTLTFRPSRPGVFLDNASVEGDQLDPVPTNNADTERTTVRTAAPDGLTCIARNDSSIFLDWNNVTGATGYNVYRASGDGPFVLLASTTESQFEDTTGTVGQTYRYRVTSTSPGGESAFSGECSATAIPLFPTLIGVALAAVGAVGIYGYMRRRKA